MIKYIYPKTLDKKREKEMITRKICSWMFGIVFFLMMIVPIMADNQIGVVQSLPPVKQGDCVILPQTCATCTYNKISSVTYPNSSLALGQVTMAQSGNSYSYSFCNTTALGRYIVNGFGDPGGSIETWAYDFNVTTTGQDDGYLLPLFLGLGAFILLIFAFLMKNNYMGFISGTLFLVLGIYTIIYGLGTVSDFYTSSIAYISLGIGLLFILASAYSAINDTNINLFKLGREEEEEW